MKQNSWEEAVYWNVNREIPCNGRMYSQEQLAKPHFDVRLYWEIYQLNHIFC